MTMTSDLNTFPNSAGPCPCPWRAAWGRGMQALTRLIRAIAKERRERRTIRTLNALDDRMLADIGVARSEIDLVARGGPARRLLLRQ
jgi:uncharacterized protein YjiS (DUF1127 family)